MVGDSLGNVGLECLPLVTYLPSMFSRFAFHIYVLFVLLFALSQQTFAQQGQLRFLVMPGHNFRVKIDGEVQRATNRFDLEAGKHLVSVWAPDYRAKDTTIVVVADSTITIVMRLVHTGAYYKWMQEHQVWRQAQGMRRWPPVLVGIAAVTTAVFSHQAMNESHLEHVTAGFDARFATGRRQFSLQTDSDLALTRFKQQRTTLIAASAVSVGAVVWAVWGFKRSNKTFEPARPVKDPWNLTDLSFAPHPDGGAVFGVRLRF